MMPTDSSHVISVPVKGDGQVAYYPRRSSLRRRADRRSARDDHSDSRAANTVNPIRSDDGAASLPRQGREGEGVGVVIPELHAKLAEKKRPDRLPHYLVAVVVLWLAAFLGNGGHL